MNENVVSFAVQKNDNRLWTPEQMLEEVLRCIRAGEGLGAMKTPNRAIVVLYEDDPKNKLKALYSYRVSNLDGLQQSGLVGLVQDHLNAINRGVL